MCFDCFDSMVWGFSVKQDHIPCGYNGEFRKCRSTLPCFDMQFCRNRFRLLPMFSGVGATTILHTTIPCHESYRKTDTRSSFPFRQRSILLRP